MIGLTELRGRYEKTKSACREDWPSKTASDAILDIAILSLRFLEKQGTPVELISRVPGKDYFSYRLKNIVARPANRRFFMRDANKVSRLWKNWKTDSALNDMSASMLYTVALAPCLAMELFDRQNKKGPATYFECLIGHIFAKMLNRNPEKQASFSIRGKSVRLTMDFLFEPCGNIPGIHLSVKMSTRERVVQAWAHQRLLDSAFGKDRYKGIMVLFSETKLDSKTMEVIEICVPDQWLAYQSLLSKMDTIYYFDVPERYRVLGESYPDLIRIRQFGDFLIQSKSIVD